MATLVGPFNVTAPPKRVLWVKSALASLDEDVDPLRLLTKIVPLTFGDVDNVPGTTSPATGYTLKGPRCFVRHDMAGASNLDKATTEYVVLHEGLGHARLMLHPIAKADWAILLGLLKGTPDGTYWSRRQEVIIDAAIEAISGIESPYRHDPTRPTARNRYRLWIDEADYPTVKTVWQKIAVPPDPPVVEPTPPVLPEPEDPCAEVVAVLTGQLEAERDAHEATKASLSTAELRLTAKDDKSRESLAI